ncbi:MAG: 16S rRNA (guanine(527)-N(7))-methyltransferase RsmG [Oscillospiraceae bacterium]|nr:16S rRNA (guanine(527)-N(7))-methyltransferase RsmG [Oscillospiraceae bacterium]
MRDKLEKYLELLVTQNEELNLTAIEDPGEVWVRHFEDSAQLLTLFNFTGARVLDLGSGAGFPGIPIRIGEPKMRLTLLDATDKKIEFLRLVCDELELAHVDCVHGRAEELGLKSGWRDGFDYVTARGVARLNMLCELALPFLRIGGRLLAMKESDCNDEVAEAANAVSILKGETEDTKRYTLSSGKQHAVVVIRKTDMTPSGYPRRYARIKAKPL